MQCYLLLLGLTSDDEARSGLGFARRLLVGLVCPSFCTRSYASGASATNPACHSSARRHPYRLASFARCSSPCSIIGRCFAVSFSIYLDHNDTNTYLTFPSQSTPLYTFPLSWATHALASAPLAYLPSLHLSVSHHARAPRLKWRFGLPLPLRSVCLAI